MSQDDDTAAQTRTERWVFGGSRVNADGKRMHAWIDSDGEELYFKPRGSHAVGVVYDVEVSRPDGGRIVRHGDPRYTGDRASRSGTAYRPGTAPPRRRWTWPPANGAPRPTIPWRPRSNAWWSCRGPSSPTSAPRSSPT